MSREFSEKIVEQFSVTVLGVGIDISLTIERVQLFQALEVVPGQTFRAMASEIYRTRGGHLPVTFHPQTAEFTIPVPTSNDRIRAVRASIEEELILL